MKNNVIYNKFSRQAALIISKSEIDYNMTNKYSSRYFRELFANLKQKYSMKETESKSNDTFACGLIFVEDT